MEQVAAVLDSAGGRAIVARAVELRGFGSRRLGEVAVVTADGVVTGSLLGGGADEQLADEAVTLLAGPPSSEVVEVAIGEGDAVAAGLACGGTARLLLQDARLIPPAWWETVARRHPAALVTRVPGAAAVVMDAGGDPSDPPPVARARELLAAGRPATEVLAETGEIVEVWWPTTRMLVVGAAVLAGALAAQAALLDWEPLTDDGADAGSALEAVRALGPADAVVVLTHDPDVAIPVLAAALGSPTGYVGALGSRRTQADRRRRLTADGLDDGAIDRIHGPVGLDLGARTPEETALAVCAEILAHRSGRGAGSLRDARGPING